MASGSRQSPYLAWKTPGDAIPVYPIPPASQTPCLHDFTRVVLSSWVTFSIALYWRTCFQKLSKWHNGYNVWHVIMADCWVGSQQNLPTFLLARYSSLWVPIVLSLHTPLLEHLVFYYNSWCPWHSWCLKYMFYTGSRGPCKVTLCGNGLD